MTDALPPAGQLWVPSAHRSPPVPRKAAQHRAKVVAGKLRLDSVTSAWATAPGGSKFSEAIGTETRGQAAMPCLALLKN